MRTLICFALLCSILHQSYAFSKYGRSCKDIGCPSSQVCVMAEDPCSLYQRDECGSYPTCQTSGSHSGPSCSTHICPPTQVCQLDNGTPKCVAERSSSTHVHKNENSGGASAPSYPPQNPSYPAQNPSYPAQNPSYPAANPSHPSGGSLYPSLSTPRPAQSGGYPAYPQGGSSGYPAYPQGGSSGYPAYPQGGSSGYPSQGGGYPAYPNYPQNNRGGSGYPNQGYPQYSGYPNQGYPQYPNNNRQGQQGSKSGSNPIVDKITDQLKTIGAGLLKNALSNVLSGNNRQQ